MHGSKSPFTQQCWQGIPQLHRLTGQALTREQEGGDCAQQIPGSRLTRHLTCNVMLLFSKHSGFAAGICCMVSPYRRSASLCIRCNHMIVVSRSHTSPRFIVAGIISSHAPTLKSAPKVSRGSQPGALDPKVDLFKLELPLIAT